MTQAESDKNAYLAFRKLCDENKNMEPLFQLKFMVQSMGADRAHVMATMNSGLPDDVKEVMHAVARHMETIDKTC